jgi:NADH-quinone oxidoreductase subunit I
MNLGILQFLWRRFGAGTATPRYPEAAAEPPPAFQGMPAILDGACRGAGDCATVCPTLAIHVQRKGPGWTWWLDRAACTGCGLCMEACPYQALEVSRAFELASHSREDLIETVHFRAVADTNAQEVGS